MHGRPIPALPLGLGFVLACFALNSIITRYVVSRGLLDPGLATAERFLAGAAALALILALRGRRAALRPTRANLLPAFFLGAYAVCISYGYAFIGAAAGTFVFYACVLLAMILGGAVEGSRPSRRAAAGAGLALAGVGVLALGRVEGTTPLGVGLLALTGLSWGAYSVLGRRSSDALGFTSRNFVALAPAMAVLGVIVGAGSVGTPAWSWAGILLVFVMGAITTALSYAVWYWALSQIGRVQGATYQLAIPVITAVLGVAWLGEAFTDRLALAAILVLAGMTLVARAPAAAESAGVPRAGRRPF